MKPVQAVVLLLIAVLLAVLPAPRAAAQSLPVSVQVQGDTAVATVGSGPVPVAEVIFTFDAPQNLSAASLGLTAQLVSITDTSLLARLPQAALNPLSSSFPLLLTIEPPSAGGLSFRSVRVEVHTHALVYTTGSSYRLFKAPLGGGFLDITDEVAPGSVRARGTTGGFSQFLVLADLRSTSTVIADKIARLRARVATLAHSERQPFTVELDQAESAVALGQYASAIAAVDNVRARAEARAGAHLPDRWRSARDLDNQAGDLIAGAASLRFSIAYLRDYGP